MRFGPLPLADAVGAVLAHSVKAGGVALKKGHVLTVADRDGLAAAGLDNVIAAKLEPGDVAEDAAATRIARAVAGPHVTASPAATGRVNLHAAVAGLLVVDTDRIDRLNLLDEAVTLATLPAFDPVEPGRMVATVKIIPFAAPEAVVAAAEGIGAEAGPLVRVAPFRPMRAGLVQTLLPGLKPSVLDKTREVTAERLAAVGGSLVAEERVPHEQAAVAGAIARLRAHGADLLLLVGASAITDRRDVLPGAVEAAGGAIIHFGMPVDPGNLLLLADLDGAPVLGLPGCARSPKLNGFDWVLQRIAADVPVTRADIMRMGVGGLLMDIPTRPLPRAKAAPPSGPKVAAIVLAGGSARRMGRNKLLEPFGGKPMLLHAVDAALASRAGPVIVVTGHQPDVVTAALEGRAVTVVHAADHAEGLSASLKAGLRALPADGGAFVVLLGDMPRVDAALVDRLIGAYAPANGRTICVPTVDGRRGNPVLWDRRYVPEMLTLSGDQGARGLLAKHSDAVVEVPMPDDAALLDVDTPEALAALTGAER